MSNVEVTSIAYLTNLGLSQSGKRKSIYLKRKEEKKILNASA